MWSGAPWQVGRFRITVLVWRPVLAPNHLLLQDRKQLSRLPTSCPVFIGDEEERNFPFET